MNSSQQKLLSEKINAAFTEERKHSIQRDSPSSENINDEEEESKNTVDKAVRDVPLFNHKHNYKTKLDDRSWEQIVKNKLRQELGKNTRKAHTKNYSTFHTQKHSITQDISLTAGKQNCNTTTMDKSGRSEKQLGFDLYQRAMQKNARLANKSREKKRERENLEMSGVTFSPSINFLSRKMSAERAGEKPEKRLLTYGTEAQEKQEIRKSIKFKEAMSYCTFRPEIDKR